MIIIDTYGAEIPDEPRIPAYMGIIDNESGVNQLTDDFNDYDGHITIERRGNSSQWNDKRPYRFETVDQDGENNNVDSWVCLRKTTGFFMHLGRIKP